jgi:hypothetical protein
MKTQIMIVLIAIMVTACASLKRDVASGSEQEQRSDRAESEHVRYFDGPGAQVR